MKAAPYSRPKRQLFQPLERLSSIRSGSSASRVQPLALRTTDAIRMPDCTPERFKRLDEKCCIKCQPSRPDLPHRQKLAGSIPERRRGHISDHLAVSVGRIGTQRFWAKIVRAFPHLSETPTKARWAGVRRSNVCSGQFMPAKQLQHCRLARGSQIAEPRDGTAMAGRAAPAVHPLGVSDKA